ncbi:MAG: serine--tRNA ligase, partial [Bacteroidetes bacterium]|nr:serine--tRNA ligase [Bacteroidota bacterium]
MLEIQRIRTDKETIIKGLQKRNIDANETIESILKLDTEWRSSKTEMDGISAELNQLAKKIGDLYKSGQSLEANALKEKTSELKTSEGNLKTKVESLEAEITKLLYTLPNVPNEQVVSGRDANDNETVYEFGSTPKFDFQPLPHWDLAKKYDLIDFELGVKVT